MSEGSNVEANTNASGGGIWTSAKNTFNLTNAQNAWGSASYSDYAGLLQGGVDILNDISSYRAQKKSYKAQAAANYANANLYKQQADMYLSSAKAYAKQARMNAIIGESNAKNERYAASFLQQSEDYSVAKSRAETRAKIGSARTSFAANGVLLEAREGSATAIWEQDEAANSAIERLNIMQQYEDSAYAHLVNAQNHLVQGYNNAAQSAAQAASAASEAFNASTMAEMEIRQWRDNLKAASKQKFGIGKAIGGAIGAFAGAFAGPAGMAQGYKMGSKFGGAFDNL